MILLVTQLQPGYASTTGNLS